MFDFELLIPIIAIVLGGLIFLVPIAGLTLRFALKPALEAYASMRELNGQGQEVRILEQRVALLEERLQGIESGAIPLPEPREQRRVAAPRIATSDTGVEHRG